MSESPVTYTLTNGVALVQMDDGKANALSYEMLTALNTALDRADAEAQSVVLAGRPGRFCAGFDLKTMTASPESAVESPRRKPTDDASLWVSLTRDYRMFRTRHCRRRSID